MKSQTILVILSAFIFPLCGILMGCDQVGDKSASTSGGSSTTLGQISNGSGSQVNNVSPGDKDEVYVRCVNSIMSKSKQHESAPEVAEIATKMSEKICARLADTCSKDPGHKSCAYLEAQPSS